MLGQNGAFWGLLFGSAFFLVPGVGPLFVAAPLVEWIVAALEGAVATEGLTALGAGLHSISIPNNSVLQHEAEVKNSRLLLGMVPCRLKSRRDLHLTSALTDSRHEYQDSRRESGIDHCGPEFPGLIVRPPGMVGSDSRLAPPSIVFSKPSLLLVLFFNTLSRVGRQCVFHRSADLLEVPTRTSKPRVPRRNREQ
jgi:hypothetical protein